MNNNKIVEKLIETNNSLIETNNSLVETITKIVDLTKFKLEFDAKSKKEIAKQEILSKRQAMDLLYKSGGLKVIMEAGANLLKRGKEPVDSSSEVLLKKLRKEPLRTQLRLLCKSLTEVESNKDQLLIIKDRLNSDLFEKFSILLLSETEDKAIENLKSFANSLHKDEIEILKELSSFLTEYQYKLVELIMNFDYER